MSEVVLGSGRAKRIPDDLEACETAASQRLAFTDHPEFCTMAALKGEIYGLTSAQYCRQRDDKFKFVSGFMVKAR